MAGGCHGNLGLTLGSSSGEERGGEESCGRAQKMWEPFRTLRDDSLLSGPRCSSSRRQAAGLAVQPVVSREVLMASGSAPSGCIDVPFREQGSFSRGPLGHLLLTVTCQLSPQHIPIPLFTQAHHVLWSKGPVSAYV